MGRAGLFQLEREIEGIQRVETVATD